MPFASQNSFKGICGRQGCISIWFTAGTTLACSNRVVRVFTEKFDTPIDLTLPEASQGEILEGVVEGGEQCIPVSRIFSISVQTSTIVGCSSG